MRDTTGFGNFDRAPANALPRVPAIGSAIVSRPAARRVGCRPHRVRRCGVVLIAGLLLTRMPLAFAADDERSVRPARQSLESIEAAAMAFLVELHDASLEPEIDVLPLDARLRLANCDAPLDARFSSGAVNLGRTTVEVFCAGSPGWRVQVRATVTVTATVWVLSRAVRRGERLDRDLLRQEQVRLGSSSGDSLRLAAAAGRTGSFNGVPGRESVEDPAPWIGREFTRAVGAGRPLVADALASPTLVVRGRRVRLLHRTSGVSIEAAGTALADARLGERVRVRNTRTGRSVDGIVDGIDEVRIP